MAVSRNLTLRPRGAAALACALGAVLAGPTAAQDSYSRPVVQPVPPPSLDQLNAAMRDLSRHPGDVAALLRAGWASLDLDDTQAALGFFKRAQAIQPQSGEIKAGLASVAVRQGDPITAVRLFAEAEASGTPMARFASDRGLALDLVGNNAAAQGYYRQALAFKADPEVTRRLALSEAIAGDQRATEATLLPLLQRRDLAAYRTRAFALAILGKGEEAVSIAETMLPAQISNRLAPYLRYMPRLTRAQQAAAANLGQFPPASEIGHDDPRIAAFSGPPPAQVASATPDSRLVPAGQPLGRGANSNERDKARNAKPSKPARIADRNAVAATRPTPAPAPAPTPAPATNPPLQRVAAAVPQQNPPAREAAPTPAPSEPRVQRVAAAVQPPTEQPRPDAAKPVLVASLDSQALAAPPAQAATEAPRPSLSISQPPPAAEPPRERVSLADAFAEFAKLPATAPRAEEAVDITKIKPVRESAKVEEPKAKPKPKPPANPSRVWVQVATGRNVKALAFDWRRLQKEGGALLARHQAYTAKWGATRRLLTGPYKTEDEAQKAVTALKKKGIDAFEFTSDEGEDVAPLK
jgi:Flp pilus assembly protein TadD